MATTKIKSTYSLDVDTVRALEDLARRWGVSKSEAMRRAVRRAAAEPDAGQASPLAAFRELQKSIGLGRERARRWAEEARAEREASSARREEKLE